MNIKGKVLSLRAIEEKDLELLQKWANDPVTQDGIGELRFPSSMDFHKTFYRFQCSKDFHKDVPKFLGL